MRFLASILIGSIAIIGCQSKKMASNDSAVTEITTPLSDSTVIISFEQTACYGTCPVYKITVLKNGYATYHGDRHVAQIGDYFATLTEEQINGIYSKANELHFFDLKERYTTNMTDLPTSRIQINTGIKEHKVSAYGEYPENLQNFIAFLGNDFQKVVWTKKK